MPPLTWRMLADAVVVAHLAFVAFVVAGGFLAWRYPLACLAHLPALVWAVWIELTGRVCPLTPLENHFRTLAGQAGYSGGFIEHYVIPVLYPPGLTRGVQWILAAALVGVNAVAYGGLWARQRRRRD